MTCLLDTHFIVWITKKSSRLRNYPWLRQYEPWGVSAVSLLEIQLLSEAGRIPLRNPRFVDAVMSDPRFEVDEVSVLALIQGALHLSWTRDPFDRLIAAHSRLRRVPLCSVDSAVLANHKLVLPELR
jgi:PIN domain nuclease of toxin-antitoxin system